MKVQRPDAMRRCLLDGAVIILGRACRAAIERLIHFDETAAEDRGADLGERPRMRTFGRHAWLGMPRASETLPVLTMLRALAMEWIEGGTCKI